MSLNFGNRIIVDVATGSYVNGQRRLIKAFEGQADRIITWADQMPPHSPTHQEIPYAFKAWALRYASECKADLVIWMDACIRPGPRALDDLWQKIARDGYWIAKNGFRNDQWTCDAAYADLFPGYDLETARRINHEVEHVVATAFGLNLNHPIGSSFYNEYLRLAQTKAFCGPWSNGMATHDGRRAPCGPESTAGHRHDQTAASLIAHRLGIKISDCPEWFSYVGGETDKTCLVADSTY